MPAGVTSELLSIGSFPLFNQDLENDMPAVVAAAKEQVMKSDGVIFVTPEYNRSLPGVLKNAIDWMSRPYGKNAFVGKRALVMGATGGAIGTALAQTHLKDILLYLDMQVIGQPEFYLGHAAAKFNTGGDLVDEATEQHLLSALAVLLK